MDLVKKLEEAHAKYTEEGYAPENDRIEVARATMLLLPEVIAAFRVGGERTKPNDWRIGHGTFRELNLPNEREVSPLVFRGLIVGYMPLAAAEFFIKQVNNELLRAPVAVTDDAAIKRGAKALHKIAYGDDVPWGVLEPADRTAFKKEAALVLQAALGAQAGGGNG